MKLFFIIILLLVLSCKSSSKTSLPSLDDYPILKACDSIGKIAESDYKKGIKVYDILGEYTISDFEQFYSEFMKQKYNIVIKASSQPSFEQECYAQSMNYEIEKQYGKGFIDKTYEEAKIEYEMKKDN